MRTHRRRVAVVASIALATSMTLSLSGCIGNPLEVVQQGIEQQVKDAIKDQTGVDFGTIPDGQMPEGFPASVPLPNGQPRGGSVVKVGESLNWTVTMVNNDEPAQLVEWLKAEAENRGFNVGIASSRDDHGTVIFENNELTVMVNVGTHSGATHTQYIVATITK